MPEIKVLNFEIMKNPLNWLIVIIMFVSGLLILEVFMQYFNININQTAIIKKIV